MKHLKNKPRYFVFMLLSVFVLGSCTKNFETVNTPPEGATDASTPAVYNAIVSSLAMSSGQYSVMNAWMYSITQQAITTGGSYPYENANGEVWTNYYSALASYRLLQSRISTTTDSTTMNNLSAEEITAIINHEKTSWGNNAKQISTEEVKKLIEFVKLNANSK